MMNWNSPAETARRDAVIAAIKAGATQLEVRETFHIHFPLLKRIMAAAGIPVMSAADRSQWTPERIEAARCLWDEGLTTPEIGRRLRASKNVVVGIARRNGFTARPSPIKRFSSPPAPKPVRLKVDRKTAIHRCVTPKKTKAPPAVDTGARPVLFLPPRSTSVCCWPIGEPHAAGFRFCDAPALPQWPYCAEHVAVAYVKPVRRAAA